MRRILIMLFSDWILVSMGQKLKGNYVMVEDEMGTSSLFQKTSAIISAHEGEAAAGLPENSLEAFSRTETIFDYVRLTKDNQMVLTHDTSLSRTTNGKVDVDQYTLALEDSEKRGKAYQRIITNDTDILELDRPQELAKAQENIELL